MLNWMVSIITSTAVSTALTAALIWFSKTWMTERLKSSIKHEYDLALETHKSALTAEHQRDNETLKAQLTERHGRDVEILRAELKSQSEATLARLNSDLRHVEADRDARRDYEYEARKNIYEQCGPLLFQLHELSEDALFRIYSLARSARNGKIQSKQIEGSRGYLGDASDYYMQSTIYKLLAPIAMFQLFRNALTHVDLRLEPRIAEQYVLAKILYFTLTCDYELAEEDPPVFYKPNIEGWGDLRVAEPRAYWRQGLALGRLDNILAMMIVEKGSSKRLLPFSDFDAVLKTQTPPGGDDSYSILDIFHNFHPRTRPILWRILITQAHLHELLKSSFEGSLSLSRDEVSSKVAMPMEKRALLDWRGQDDGNVPLSHVRNEPFDVAVRYITRYVADMRHYFVPHKASQGTHHQAH